MKKKLILLCLFLNIFTSHTFCSQEVCSFPTSKNDAVSYEFFIDIKTHVAITAGSLAFSLSCLRFLYKDSLDIYYKSAFLLGIPFFGYCFLFGAYNLLHRNQPYLRVTEQGLWSRHWGFIPWHTIRKIRLRGNILIDLIESELVITDVLSVPLDECYAVIKRFYDNSQQQPPSLAEIATIAIV